MDGVVGKMGYNFVQKIGPNTVPDMNENPDCIKIQEYIELNPSTEFPKLSPVEWARKENADIDACGIELRIMQG